MAFDLKDYVEVKDRLAEWYEHFPEGRITSRVTEHTETRVTVRAKVYRDSNPDSMPAGIGHSSLNIPGSTPYTKGSEIENAETSAWGRALAAAGISTKHSIASRDEVVAKGGGGKKDSSSPKSVKGKPDKGRGSAGEARTGTASEPETDGTPAQLVHADACPHPEASRYPNPAGTFVICGMCGTAKKNWLD